MVEEWKDVPEYEGLYQASTLGMIRNAKNNKILKPQLSHKGYLRVILHSNKKIKFLSIHRLVALTFIPNDEFKNEVNHIDLVKTNNSVSNLEWVTRKENVHHYLKDRPNKRKINCKQNKRMRGRVLKFSTSGELINSYDSITSACKESNVCISSICLCISGKYNVAGGFIWMREDSCVE